MSQRRRPLLGFLIAALALAAFASSGWTISFADAAGGARFGGGGRGGVHVGATSAGRRFLGSHGPAVHTGFGGGFRGGVGHHRHRGFGRPTTRHQFRTPSHGLHRLHRRSSVIFNLGGFVYPPYYSYPSYYSPIPYYPSYPAFSTPYDPGYSAVNVPYSYPDPVGAYPQPVESNVQVYTAPPEPPPAPPRQPAPTLEHLSPPLPLDDGSLHFEVSPPEAKLFLNDRFLGEARELKQIAEITAPAGRHLLEIRLDTERTFTEVVVSPRKVTPVRWALAPSPVPLDATMAEGGRLRVQVAPPGASIYIDGVFSTVADLAHPPSLSVSPGHHRVQVLMPGYKVYSTDVIVPESGEAVVEVQLARE